MSFKLEIPEPAETAEEMAERLEYIAGLLRDGNTSGFHPAWSLTEE